MALRGTLGDFSLADIFQLIGLQRKTGVLELRAESLRVTVSFEAGNVVAVDHSDRPLEQRVGQLLVRTGKLPEARLEQALQIQRDTLERLGHVLVENQWIAADVIRRQLTTQFCDTIYDLFRWRGGDYDFQPASSVEWDREFIEPIPAENLLMEGARMLDEWPMIEKVIPSRDTVLRPTLIAAKTLATVGGQGADGGSVYEEDIDFGVIPSDPLAKDEPAPKFSERELQVLRWVDGRRAAGEIAELTEWGIFEGMKTLAKLVEARMIETIGEDRPSPATAASAPRFFRTAWPARVWLTIVIAGALWGVAVLAGDIYEVVRPGAGSWPVPALVPLNPSIAGVSGLEDLRRASVPSRLVRLEQAMMTHFLDTGVWPRKLSVLADTGLVEEKLLRDPWGRPIDYSIDASRCRLSVLPPGPASREIVRIHDFTSEERTSLPR